MKHFSETEHRQLDLSFVVRNGQTLLDRRLFSYPYVLMRTFRMRSATVHTDERGRSHGLQLIVQNSSGPVHDRDDLAINLRLGEGAATRVAFQGATAIHRARSGNVSRERLTISLAAGSHLAYLPEARIYFPEARHHQQAEIELGTGSTLVFTDSFTTHDPDGAGRPLRELDNTLTVRRDGETVLLDRQHLANPLFGNGFRAFGTVLLIGHSEPILPEIPSLYAAASRLPSGLGWSVRLAAADLRPIRAAAAALVPAAELPSTIG